MNRIAMPRLAAALLFLFPIGPLGARLAAAQSSDAKLAELGQLASADDAKGALEKLVAALGHDVPRGQLTAALAIAALADRPPADTAGDDGPDFATAAAALLPLLATDDAGLVRAAATALGTIGPVGDDDFGDDTIDALSRAITRVKDAETRAACLVALADFGPAARAAVPTVAKFLRGKTALVRESAAATLAAIGPESRGATGELARPVANQCFSTDGLWNSSMPAASANFVDTAPGVRQVTFTVGASSARNA